MCSEQLMVGDIGTGTHVVLVGRLAPINPSLRHHPRVLVDRMIATSHKKEAECLGDMHI